MPKILAIDYGEKHIGLALSDEEKHWAFPYGKIEKESERQVYEEIKKICQKEEVERIVVGLPLSLSRSPRIKIERIQNFICQLEEIVNIPTDFEDERLTSRAAEVLLKEAGQKKIKKKVDQTAAVLILETYLKRKYTKEQ